MPITLTEEEISQRLLDAVREDPSSDRFSEVELTEETRLKCAAVLVPLVWHDEEWHLLYTRRTDTVKSHKGQVSFPGGACDEGETTPEETALREADEEIGLNPNDVRVLGRLPNLITITYFRVTPVIGVVKWPMSFVSANMKWRAFSRFRWRGCPTRRIGGNLKCSEEPVHSSLIIPMTANCSGVPQLA